MGLTPRRKTLFNLSSSITQSFFYCQALCYRLQQLNEAPIYSTGNASASLMLPTFVGAINAALRMVNKFAATVSGTPAL
jgi:hypothetical protein